MDRLRKIHNEILSQGLEILFSESKGGPGMYVIGWHKGIRNQL